MSDDPSHRSSRFLGPAIIAVGMEHDSIFLKMLVAILAAGAIIAIANYLTVCYWR